MKILAIDSSAIACSVAVSVDAHILASDLVHNGLTYSQTLMPMVDKVLRQAQCSIHDIDLFAVTNGPGSFTGVRIGVATIKGLAFAENKPCIGISTLEAIAANADTPDAIVVACMDARRSQIYTATFESVSLNRLSDDEAVAAAAIADRVRAYEKPVYLSGDGASLTYDILKDTCDNVSLLPENKRFQNAEKVCQLAFLNAQNAIDSALLVPTYLRPSQAERELKKRKEMKV